MVRPALLAALVLAAALPASAQRLGDAVVPQHYSLWLAPNLDDETFRGRTTIEVVLTEDTSAITLHAAELEFATATVTSGGRTQTARVAMDEVAETATLEVPDTLREGPATIAITYTGTLNDKLRGFYISRANGRKYAVTQLEATDARRAFPSFDEPAFKATFDIAVTIDEADTAISNGRLVRDTPGPDPGTHTLTFERTQRMSTYLAAIIVGDFACREGAADGTTIRVCATPDKLPLAAFALDVAEHQLAYLNEYFGIDYPFGKLDLVAVPDFSAGAMENAGAIVFRERWLLIDPATASLGSRKNVAGIIAHELAHQWFGNLVTMRWWDDIWLNEGFATWMTSKPLADRWPEWRIDLDDADDTHRALGLDALASTRAIRLHVETPAEINEVFDGIAYQKTAAVLRMIEAYVGPDAFRAAVRAYLTRFAFSNATGEDFWTVVSAATGVPIDRMLSSYVTQTGAPVLTVRRSCSAETSRLTLDQERFHGGAAAGIGSERWVFPACVATGGGARRCEVIDGPRQELDVAGCGPLFSNAGARGYYFTDLPPDEVRRLAGAVGLLTPAERITLLGDEWWMARSGRHDIDVYLDLASALATDTTSAVVSNLAARLATIGTDLVPERDQEAYRAWVRATFGPALSALGLPGEASDVDELQQRRATLLELVGLSGGDPDVQRRARELANRYLDRPESLPGTLVPVVLRVAAIDGDAALYDRYLAQMEASESEPERYYRFFGALTSFRDPALVDRTLALARSEAVRSQDAATLIGGLLAQPQSGDRAWQFVQAEWPALLAKLEEFQGLPGIIGSLGAFCSTGRADEVRRFFDANPLPSSERTIQRAVERIETCAALAERQAAPLAAWIARQ